MKTSPANAFLLWLLVTCIGSTTSRTSAQTFTTLRSFTATAASSPYTNSDGARLNAELLLAGDRLYGTAGRGGQSGNGTVFAMNTDGTGFTNLHSFSAATGGSPPNIANTDGVNPQGGLILSGNTLYGTTLYGGTNGNGTVFAINVDGAGFTNLHTFTSVAGALLSNTDGVSPYAGLVLSGNTVFGTTIKGGSYGKGTIFAINTDGASFTTLHSFKGSDGASPYGGLVLSSNALIGVTIEGGGHGYGTLFAVNSDGSSFTNLHSFTSRDGVTPFAGLVLSDKTLYGTASGGTYGYGAVFAIQIDGTGFTNLHSFNQSDGWQPQDRLILSSYTLYGTTTYGGANGNGTAFAINTDGTDFTNLHHFTATVGVNGTNSDGGYPVGGLILSGKTLYGTTHIGGSWGSGTVFSLSLPPPRLIARPLGGNLGLMWPTNAPGFILQSTTNLGPSAIWTTNLPAPAVVNGRYTVTNPISGTQQFFRLIQ